MREDVAHALVMLFRKLVKGALVATFEPLDEIKVLCHPVAQN
jgi:hypothetical protein